MSPKLARFRAQNHLGLHAPFFAANHAVEAESGPPSGGEEPAAINVVSYNIFYGRNIAGAIDDLVAIQSQRRLDILLLQEMDESGTDAIASALRLNYVYYPSAVASHHQRNFGNAVLALWPLEAPEKLLLPHRSLTTRMVRTATKVNVRLGARLVVAISAHTETIFTWPSYRRAQHLAVGSAGGESASHVVVGGDFNTVNAADGKRLRQVFAERGLQHVSAEGPTLVKRGVRVTADHIFARGFVVAGAGIFSGAQGSDHRPLWTCLTFAD